MKKKDVVFTPNTNRNLKSLYQTLIKVKSYCYLYEINVLNNR